MSQVIGEDEDFFKTHMPPKIRFLEFVTKAEH